MSKAVLDKLCAHLRDGVLETHAFRGDETAIIQPQLIRAAALWLRDTDEIAMSMLTDLTAVDYLGYPDRDAKPRFEMVYHFYSVMHGHRLRLRVGVDEKAPEVDTISDIYGNANWCEREVWDMYGIMFKDHPDPRRILMYEEFEGHPLRKDYPKTKRQPLVRRPQREIDFVMGTRPHVKRDLSQ